MPVTLTGINFPPPRGDPQGRTITQAKAPRVIITETNPNKEYRVGEGFSGTLECSPHTIPSETSTLIPVQGTHHPEDNKCPVSADIPS